MLDSFNVSVHALPKTILFAIRGTRAIFWETLKLRLRKKADSWLKLSLTSIGLLYAQPLFTDKLAPCSSKTLTELLYLVFQYLIMKTRWIIPCFMWQAR